MDSTTEPLFQDPHWLDSSCHGCPELEFDSQVFWDLPEPLAPGEVLG